MMSLKDYFQILCPKSTPYDKIALPTTIELLVRLPLTTVTPPTYNHLDQCLIYL